MNSESTLSDALSEVDVAIAAGNPERALALTDELLAAYPDAVAIARARARAFDAAGRPDQAAQAYARALEVLPADVGALTGYATALDASGRVGEARVAVLQALDHAPGNRNLMRVAAKNGALDSPDPTSRRFRQALDGAQAGLIDRALPQLRRVTAEWPDRTDAQLALAQTLWRSGARAQAAEVCQSILDAQPDCLFAHALLLKFWRDAGPLGLDVAHVRAVRRLDPDHQVTVALLGLDSPVQIEDVPAMPPQPDAGDDVYEDEQMRSAYVDELLANVVPPPVPAGREPATGDVSAPLGTIDASPAEDGPGSREDAPPAIAPLEWDSAEDWTEAEVPIERTAGWVPIDRPSAADFVPARARSIVPDPRDGVPPAIERLEWSPEANGDAAPVSLAPPEAAPPGEDPPSAPPRKRSSDRLEAARRAMEEARWREAAELFGRAIPSLRGKRLDEAIGDLEAVARARPGWKEIWDLLGMAYAQRGDNDAALDAYRRAMLLNPEA